jgi:hypothetical protein
VRRDGHARDDNVERVLPLDIGLVHDGLTYLSTHAITDDAFMLVRDGDIPQTVRPRWRPS